MLLVDELKVAYGLKIDREQAVTINNQLQIHDKSEIVIAGKDLMEEFSLEPGPELGKILNYVDMLNELDTTGVEEMSHPFNFTNNFREDEAVNTENREALLANAPEQKDGCFKVPQTVE